MRRLSLAARIALIMIVALGCVWIVLLTVHYRLQGRDTEGVHPAPGRLAALVSLLESAPPAQRGAVLDAVTSDLFAARVEAGNVPASLPPAPLDAKLREAYVVALRGRPLTITVPPQQPPRRFLARLLSDPRNALEFRIALSTGNTLVVDTRNAVLLTSAGLPVGFGAGLFGTVIALAALVFMQREMTPLTRLAAAVDRMDVGGEPALLPQTGRGAPEIQALVSAFNRLQTRLSGLLRARMAMLGGLSHDVRTFATRLRLRLDHLLDGPDRDRVIADIADMIRLLDDALLASRAGAGELAQELVELDEIVRADVADRQANGAPVTLTVTPHAVGATVLGDRLALRRVIANLVDNALRYARTVEVEIAAEASGLVLTVDDDGPGIPPEQRDMLLEPFVRLDASRNRGTGGAGLGLAVVRNLVEAQGGTVAIADAPRLGGARLVVRLPRFKPA
jgi:signal transduction histidine kinase